MNTLAERWPYLLLLVAMWILIRWGMPMSAWVRRRRLRTIARRAWARRGGSSEQHGMDRGDK
jgi:predicted DCC family thiol-disulfide oxidoreductase YuxK